MNYRVRNLRKQSVETVPSISIERAELVTEVYKEYEGRVSVPMLRALTFKHLMENKTVCISPGELIVGERGPMPQGTPTYPELCCHSLEDLEIINSRDKIFFKVDDHVKDTQRDKIIPYWEGRSIRNIIFRQMSDEWLECYNAGIFTEFMEQRAPGHTVADGKIYNKGFLDFKRDITGRRLDIDLLKDPDAYDKREQLTAMEICADAIIAYARRHAEAAEKLAAVEEDPIRKNELKEIARVCTRVPAHAPKSFWEALQAYWFVHIGVISELNTWDSFNPGKLDQHLYPFYRKGIEDGTLTRESAMELLGCFWIKFNNQPAPPKVGVTLAESGTYTDFANINIGGIRPDGSDGVNEISYMLLEVIGKMKTLQPSTNVQISQKNPDRFIRKACEVIRMGMGFPSVFNSEAVIKELIRQGKSIEDARCGGTSGCVEAGAFGKEAYILTGYFNIPKVLEITLNNGLDKRTGKWVGLKTGDPLCFKSYGELFDAFQRQMRHFLDIKIKGNNIIEKLYAYYMPSPFLSIIVDDCIKKGKDYNAGGARYNSNYIQGVGIGTITDCLSAIRYHVYDSKTMTMAELLAALENNFENHEKIRQLLINKTPKYGNDDDYADNIMVSVFETFFDLVDSRKNLKGGDYRINMLPTTCHIYFGSVTRATSDGRKMAQPLSEGISPVQGADRHGPTAVIKSASKMDHIKTGGTLLNQKFSPQVLEGNQGLERLTHLIRSYFRLDGHHIQFNVVSANTLREAQKHPEEYAGLIVRVAGYSDYFNNLNKELQDEIITRTEHCAF